MYAADELRGRAGHARLIPFPCPNLDNIKKLSCSAIYPALKRTLSCTLLLMSNLAQPDWISVNCKEAFLAHVFCFHFSQMAKSQEHFHKNISSLSECSTGAIVVNSTCYRFQWVGATEKITPFVCQILNLKSVNLSLVQVENIIMAVKTEFPNLLTPVSNNSFVHVLKCSKYYLAFECKAHLVWLQHAEGFLVYTTPKQNATLGTNMFKCQGGVFVFFSSRCDGKIDCFNDGNDEQDCTCKRESQELNMCKTIITDTRNITCGSLYFLTFKGQCVQYSWPTASAIIIQIISHKSFHNDMVVDNIKDHEQDYKDLLKHGLTKMCSFPHELHCRQGHSKCFNITHICFYSINQLGHLQPCRSGEHLENCQFFECNARYKCEKSYCIPWVYVCDSKWDCPFGEDESAEFSCTNELRCEGMFRCKHTQQACVHLKSVCDNVEDCPLNDDEESCQLKGTSCPPDCVCLGYALKCHQLSSRISTSSFVFASFSSSKSSYVKSFLDESSSVRILHLTQTDGEFCHVQFSSDLIFLNISFHIQTSMEKNCLSNYQVVNSVILEHNQIGYICSNAFVNLSKLHFLSLSHNPVTNFPQLTYIRSHNINLLSIENVTFSSLEANAFQFFCPKVVFTGDYQICCIAPSNSTCTANILWYQSCSGLLPGNLMRTMYLVVSGVLVALSILHVVVHALTFELQKCFCTTIICLNVSYMLLVVYLKIMAICDWTFQEDFAVMQEWWTSSLTCHTAFGVILWFLCLHQLLLTFLSLQRLMVVLQPVDTAFKHLRFICKWLLSVCLSTLLFALFAVILSMSVFQKVPSVSCLPFVDPTKSNILVIILSWFLAVSHVTSSLTLIVKHVMTVFYVFQSQKDISKTGSSSNFAMILQLVIVSISNVICWIPLSTMTVVFLSLDSYPIREMVSYTIAAVVPVNSVINPVVFSVFSLRKMYKEAKKKKGNI